MTAKLGSREFHDEMVEKIAERLIEKSKERAARRARIAGLAREALRQVDELEKRARL